MLALLLLAALPDLSNVLVVFSAYGMGHACAISENLALTNNHIVNPVPDGPYAQRWSQGDVSGVADVVLSDPYSDLALIRSKTPFPHWYKIAAAPPAVGDNVSLVGFNWKNKKEGMAPKEFTFQVTRVLAEHILFDGDAKPGSSGSCVLNAHNEVVGINMGTVDAGTDLLGIAVGVWAHKPEETKEE